MSNAEFSREILNDYDKIVNSSTLARLATDYYHERLKLHIKKETEYVRYYEIKSKSKNKWICIVLKDNLLNKYQKVDDCGLILFTYYYSKNGLCVFNVTLDEKVEAYFGHLYSRYRERMDLAMPNLLDVVKYYMKNNYLVNTKQLPETDGKIKAIGIIREGIIFGDYDSANQFWVFKTFIRNETANLSSISERIKLINNLKNALLIKDTEGDNRYYQDLKLYLESLNKEEMNEKKNENESVLTLLKPKIEPIVQSKSDFVAFIKNQAKTN